MIEFFSFIIFCICFLIMLKLFLKKEYFHPIFLSSLYWIAFLLISISISFVFDLEFCWNGIFPIFILLFSFITGSALFGFYIKKNRKTAINVNKTVKDESFKFVNLKPIIIIFSIIGCIALIVQLAYLNFSISKISDIFAIAHKISVLRYSDQIDMPKYGLFLIAFLYSGVFWGGIFNLKSYKKIDKLISILPLIVALIFTIINGVKITFLFSMIIWISGYIASYVYLNKGIILNSKKIAIKFLIVSFFIFLSIPLIYYFRRGEINSEFSVLNSGTISYFASYNSFSIWWDHYHFNTITPFKYSLSGIHNLFTEERVTGLYLDNLIVGFLKGKIIISNVYTIIRGLIEDFSLLGAIIIMFFTGIIMTYFYWLAKQKKILGVLLLGICYSVLFWSFTVNMLNYNTILFSWMISFFVLILLRYDLSIKKIKNRYMKR